MSEARSEIKVGEGVYAPRGFAAEVGLLKVIIGAPRLKGERWVTIAGVQGGQLHSFPESVFEEKFRRVE